MTTTPVVASPLAARQSRFRSGRLIGAAVLLSN